MALLSSRHPGESRDLIWGTWLQRLVKWDGKFCWSPVSGTLIWEVSWNYRNAWIPHKNCWIILVPFINCFIFMQLWQWKVLLIRAKLVSAFDSSVWCGFYSALVCGVAYRSSFKHSVLDLDGCTSYHHVAFGGKETNHIFRGVTFELCRVDLYYYDCCLETNEIPCW